MCDVMGFYRTHVYAYQNNVTANDKERLNSFNAACKRYFETNAMIHIHVVEEPFVSFQNMVLQWGQETFCSSFNSDTLTLLKLEQYTTHHLILI